MGNAVRTINCFPIVPNYSPSACARESFNAQIIHYLCDTSSLEGIKREIERRREEMEGREYTAACRIVKNGTARYILMQILYRILVLRERAIHFLPTRNSTSPTATCLSRDVCIVQLKDIQKYAKGARRGILESHPYPSRLVSRAHSAILQICMRM